MKRWMMMVGSVVASLVVALVGAMFSAPSHAQDATTAVGFAGRDGNWFNPANWSHGRVPGPQDDVVLDGTDNVVIDPARGFAWVQVRDLVVRDRARLETRAGTILDSRDEVVEGHGRIVLRASASIGESFVASSDANGRGGWCIDCAIAAGNPSPKQKRIIVLQSSLTSEVGLGGTIAASIGVDASGAPVVHAGPGTYASLKGDTVSIDGHLWLTVHYGFAPVAGDRFRIVEATRRATGRFIGLDEGDLVAVDGTVGLYITYEGGDGNDVELVARPIPPSTLLLPAIQKVREANRIRTAVLLARQLRATLPR